MDSSRSDDEDFLSRDRRPISPIYSVVSVTKDLDDSSPATPPADYSSGLMSSLGLVVTPDSPPYRKVRSMKLDGTPTSCHKSRLEVPAFSTPAGSPCVIKLPRSLRNQRHKSKFELNEKLNLSVGHVPQSLVNPFSPYRTNEKARALSKKSRIEKEKVKLDYDDDDEFVDDEQKNIKRPRLSDFNCQKFEKDFMVMGILGSGVHGCVYKCLNLLTGTEYAVKRSLKPINNEKVARNEIFAHAALEHPHIVMNYVSWTEDDYVFMQNEYCNGGSLEDHIKNNGPMEEKELMVLLEHLAQGLRYIHNLNIAHMDLKPGNVFLTEERPKLYHKHHDNLHHDPSDSDNSKEETKYKIGDLGHVIKVDDPGYVEDGDCRYLPREMLLNSRPEDYTKVDIFALGLTLYEAAGGGPLPKNGEEWHNIRNGQIKTFPHLSPQFNSLIKRMISEDPKERPSATELLDEISRDEGMTDRELKEANQKIRLLQHQLSSFVKSVSKSVSTIPVRTTTKKRTTNSNNSNQVMPARAERFTRSRLVGRNTAKSPSAH